jgi:hypothetical protein
LPLAFEMMGAWQILFHFVAVAVALIVDSDMFSIIFAD